MQLADRIPGFPFLDCLLGDLDTIQQNLTSLAKLLPLVLFVQDISPFPIGAFNILSEPPVSEVLLILCFAIVD